MELVYTARLSHGEVVRIIKGAKDADLIYLLKLIQIEQSRRKEAK